MKKKLLTGVFAVMLAVFLAAGLAPAHVSAATKKTVKQCVFKSSVKKIEQYAATVKAGTYDLTVKRGEGFLKFKAPATKNYSFTYSNIKGKYSFEAYVAFFLKTGRNSMESLEVSTKGGKTDVLHLTVNGEKHQGGKLKDRPIKKRTGTVKLKKGQTIYMYFYDIPAHNTAKLVVK